MRERYDAIIIGTGQSGPPLAVAAGGRGRKVAIIERKRFGGTCVNTGCMPTKTLVASAYAAHLARRAADYGVIIDGPVRVDMKRVKARKDAVAANASRGVEKWLQGHRQPDRDRGPCAFRIADHGARQRRRAARRSRSSSTSAAARWCRRCRASHEDRISPTRR